VQLRNLLRPSWLALTLMVFAFAIACFMLLSPWQFRRNAERETTNDQIIAAKTTPPADLHPGMPEWRLARVTGEYVANDEIIARLRTVQGEPAYEVMVPFKLASGQTILIDRGFLRPEQSRVPTYPAPPTGQVTVLGRVRADETDPENRKAFADDSTQGKLHAWAVDSRTVARATGLQIQPGYVQLEANTPGILGPLPLPELDSGPFLSYALQWIVFGAMAFLGWIYFTWRELMPGGALAADRERPRRRSVAAMVAEEEAAEREAATSV
jgi:cytochrome oxidase assembly protein ShyY1